MKLRFKEEPAEWRKTALLTVVGLAVISSLLRWRKILPAHVWLSILAALALIAVAACVMPRWFRGYYRFSQRLGFRFAQWLGVVVLGIFFVLVITPVGLLLRAFGQDPLRLKRSCKEESYWQTSKPSGPIDRIF